MYVGGKTFKTKRNCKKCNAEMILTPLGFKCKICEVFVNTQIKKKKGVYPHMSEGICLDCLQVFLSLDRKRICDACKKKQIHKASRTWI